jgi:hypothetical protein
MVYKAIRYFLLILVFAIYVIPWYNFKNPTLFGIPFFYWWIIAMYPVSTLILIAYTYLIKENHEEEVKKHG